MAEIEEQQQRPAMGEKALLMLVEHLLDNIKELKAELRAVNESTKEKLEELIKKDTARINELHELKGELKAAKKSLARLDRKAEGDAATIRELNEELKTRHHRPLEVHRVVIREPFHDFHRLFDQTSMIMGRALGQLLK